MRIVIETDGSQDGTRVTLNGRPVEHIFELDFTFRPGQRKGMPCLYVVHGSTEQPRKAANYMRCFGNDFQRYDEYFPPIAPAPEPAVTTPGDVR